MVHLNFKWCCWRPPIHYSSELHRTSINLLFLGRSVRRANQGVSFWPMPPEEKGKPGPVTDRRYYNGRHTLLCPRSYLGIFCSDGPVLWKSPCRLLFDPNGVPLFSCDCTQPICTFHRSQFIYGKKTKTHTAYCCFAAAGESW